MKRVSWGVGMGVLSMLRIFSRQTELSFYHHHDVYLVPLLDVVFVQV
jgi:hypothetical protein